MRRITFNSKLLGSGAAAALSVGLIGCKGDLDPEPFVDGAVPPVGQAVAGAPGDPAAPPGTIAPNAISNLDPLNPGGLGAPILPGSGLAETPGVAPDMATVPYEIKKGDSLSKIAGEHGTTIGTLQQLNGITGSFIRYGQTIKVPAPPGVAPLTPSPTPSGVPSSITPPSAPAGAASPPLPETPVAPTAPSGVGGANSGLGFGGDSALRPRTPTRDDGGFLDLPAPD